MSDASLAAKWLTQFGDAEREAAAALIDEMLLVNHDEFRRGIYALLDHVMESRTESGPPVALFAERPVKKDQADGTVSPIYPDSRRGRALGPGVEPITANPNDQLVGSEGIVANVITNY